MTKEDELARYAYIIEDYKDQLASLETQFSFIQSAILENTKAKMTIEQMDKLNDDNEILLPIGGGAYINASTKKTSKLLLDVGAGIVIEKNTNDVIENIDKQIENLQQTQQKISSMVQQLQVKSDEVSKKAQDLLKREK